MKRLLLVVLMILASLAGMVGFSHADNEVSALQAAANTTNEAVASSVAAAQPTHAIVCRGGGELSFNYTPFSNFSPDPQIWITFQRGAQKAGSNWENIGALMPGQCSWLDRPVSNNEPNRIIVKDIKNFSIFWNRGQVVGISSDLSYMNWLQDAKYCQSFNVYNDSKGNFILTGIGQARGICRRSPQSLSLTKRSIGPAFRYDPFLCINAGKSAAVLSPLWAAPLSSLPSSNLQPWRFTGGIDL